MLAVTARATAPPLRAHAQGRSASSSCRTAALPLNSAASSGRPCAAAAAARAARRPLARAATGAAAAPAEAAGAAESDSASAGPHASQGNALQPKPVLPPAPVLQPKPLPPAPAPTSSSDDDGEGDAAVKRSSPKGKRKRLLVVVAAVLVNEQGQVLLAQRPPGKTKEGLWEFPGGKVDPGEGPEEALARELREEVGVEADPAALEPLTFVSATGNRSHFHLLMPIFACRQWAGEPRGAEGQALAWVSMQQLAGADTAEGGRYALAPAVRPRVMEVLHAIERQRQRTAQPGQQDAAAAAAAGDATTAPDHGG